jgi:hypothetical protein
MEKMTITEGLSELNLIKKKIKTKENAFLGNLILAEHVKDPYENEGGTPEHLKKEFQSLTDLRRRLVKIRSAIASANLENEITLGEMTFSIHDWLTWKREISKEETSFINSVVSGTKSTLDKIAQQPQIYKDSEEKTHLVKFKTCIDYPEFVRKQEKMQELFENLDGKLSLKNATIVIQF